MTTLAAALASEWVAKRRLNTGGISRVRATRSASVAVERLGRLATMSATSAAWAATSGALVAVIQPNIIPSTRWVIAGSPSLGRAT